MRLSDPPLVLVVDDDDIVRRVAVISVRRLGLRVVEAASGAAALAVLASDVGVDVIVSDVQLGDMTARALGLGYERVDADVPVLWTSGYPEAEVGRRLGSEPAHFVMKPYDARTLRDALRVALVGRPERTGELIMGALAHVDPEDGRQTG